MHAGPRSHGASPSAPAAPRRDTELCGVVLDNTRGGRHHDGTLHGTSLRRDARTGVVLLELVGAQPGAVFRVGPPGALLGRSEGADVVFRDATVSAAHAQIHVEDGVVVVEDLSSLNGTFVNDKRVARTERLTDGDYVRLGSTLLKFSMMDDLEERVLRTLFELARHDPMTGLFNRRYFDERLRSEFLFARRHDTLVGLLFIDIDRFKRVNDTRGHATGDAVLKLVASSIQRMMRPEDVLSRHGGEEFTAILRATSLRNLQILGARVCQRVETLALEPAPHEFSVTVSIGVSQSGPDRRYDSPEALLAAADVALYAAKSAGGNRVVLAPSPT